MSDDNDLMVSQFSEFHRESIYYRTPEKTGNSRVIKMVTPGGDPILIETPRLRVSRVYYNEDSKENGYIEFYFPADSQDFYNFITDLDDYHMQTCHESSTDWFNGRELTIDFIEGAYKSIVMPPKKAGNPCRLRVELPVKYGKLQSSVYNQHMKPMSIHDSSGMNVICILRMVQLEISRTNFRCVWELEQMKVFEKKKRLTECYIKELPEDEKWLSDEDEDMIPEMEY